MRLLRRAHPLALAAVTTAALMAPVAAPAPASAAQVVAATPSASPGLAVTKERKKKSSRSARSFAARSKIVLKNGYRLRGTPYRYGGSTPRGFDCSGFTMYLYRKAGKRLPHTATGQMHRAKRISAKSVRAGDLVFFRKGSRAYHVGIYAGKHRVLHSPRPGKTVRVDRIWTSNVTYGRAL